MTAVLASSKNHAMTYHHHANPKRRLVQAAVSTMYTPLDMSPPTGGILQIPLDTCQMTTTTGSRCPQQVQPTLNLTNIWNCLDLTKGYIGLIGVYIDFVLLDISRKRLGRS